MKQYILLLIYTAIASSTLTLAIASVGVILYIVQPFQKTAVDRGFATWEVVNNATGKTVFTWAEGVAQGGLHAPNPDILASLEQPISKK